MPISLLPIIVSMLCEEMIVCSLYDVGINGNATFAGFQFPPFNTNCKHMTPSNPFNTSIKHLYPDNGSDMLAVLHYSGAPNAEPPSPAPTVLPPTATPFVEFKAKVC